MKYPEIKKGDKFGKLYVLSFAYKKKNTDFYLCKCECGTEKNISKYNLLSGTTKSCGCLQKETASLIKTKHGFRKQKRTIRLYRVWIGIKQRCYNKKNIRYQNYGARGIKVCDEWKNSFQAFYDWAVSTGYDENAKYGEYTIERKDVNGNYCPENCCWVNMIEQANNRTSNIQIEFDGLSFNLKQLSDFLGIKYSTLYSRLKRNGRI